MNDQRPMQILNRVYDIFKSASLLAVVLMLAFTVPMSANTNITDRGSIEHHEMNLDHLGDTLDMTSHDNTNGAHEHDDVGCCKIGMCISAALVEEFNISEAEQTQNHTALLISKMTSAGNPSLMRPPSL